MFWKRPEDICTSQVSDTGLHSGSNPPPSPPFPTNPSSNSLALIPLNLWSSPAAQSVTQPGTSVLSPLTQHVTHQENHEEGV